ncbi:MAG: hypothetical protein KF832_31085 [Caldilineaceae bacterium]|nr:hypothetical protein [Caldilineaceae bacterium]
MNTRTVLLGGHTYEIEKQRFKANEAWRQEVIALLDPLLEQVKGLSPDLEFNHPFEIIEVVRPLFFQVRGAFQAVVELLLRYSPALQADRERILEAAYDEELLDAFVVCLRLAFGFLAKLSSVSGLLAPATTPNLPAANGDAGTTTSVSGNSTS